MPNLQIPQNVTESEFKERNVEFIDPARMGELSEKNILVADFAFDDLPIEFLEGDASESLSPALKEVLRGSREEAPLNSDKPQKRRDVRSAASTSSLVPKNTGVRRKEEKLILFDDTCPDSWHDLNRLPSSAVKELQTFLKDLLLSSLDGQAVLRAFETGSFDNAFRKTLVDLIVINDFNNSFDKKISAERFKFLALSIVALFPTESALIYYMPQINLGHGKKQCPRGKLYQKYIHKLKTWRTSGLIDKKRAPRQAAPDEETACESDELVGELADPLFDEDLRWLNRNTEPHNLVVDKWRETCPKRIRWLRTSNLRIEDYFNQLPALKEDLGHQLIEMDFNYLYPDKEHIFFDTWPALAENIIDLVRKKQRNDRSFKKNVESDIPESLLGDLENDVAKAVFCVCALPSLCASIKFQSMKHARKDVKDFFVLHVPTKSQLMKELRKRSEENRKNNRVFPIPVFVGDVDNLDSYVEMNDNLYSVDSPIQAVDTCFKFFMALNVKFPPASSVIWMFLQHYVYKISMPSNQINPQLEALAVDLGVN